MTTVTYIRPHRGFSAVHVKELWEYRDLMFFMIWREVKGRYKQTALGPLWIVLNPVFNMVVFTVIFGMVARLPSDGMPYPLFNYSALLPWTLFANAVGAVTGSLRSYNSLISKVYFPRMIIPVTAAISGLVDFAVQFVILLGMSVWYGFYPGWNLLMAPVYLVLALAWALAIGLWCAGWAAHFWDVQTIQGMIVRLWMYATPVVYSVSLIPEKWREIYALNPLTQVVGGFQWAVLGQGIPPGRMLVVAILMVVPLLVSGAYMFRRAERNIVDVV